MDMKDKPLQPGFSLVAYVADESGKRKIVLPLTYTQKANKEYWSGLVETPIPSQSTLYLFKNDPRKVNEVASHG